MKIFNIEFANNELIVTERNNFEDNFDWLNKNIVYNIATGNPSIYCDEEHLEACKNKLINSLIQEHEEKIKEENNKIDKLKMLLER